MSAIVSLLRVMTLRDAEAITLEAGKVPTLPRRGQVEALAMPALEAQLLDDFATPLLAGKPAAEGPQMVAFVDDDGATYPVTLERVAAGFRMVVRRGAKPTARPASGSGGASAGGAACRSGSGSAPGSASASWVGHGVGQPGVGHGQSGLGHGVGQSGVGHGVGQSGVGHGVGQSGVGHGVGQSGVGQGGGAPGGGHPGVGQSGVGQSGVGQSGVGHPSGQSADRHGSGDGHGVGVGSWPGFATRTAYSAAIREQLAQLLGAPVAIAHERGASDVFLSTGNPPRVRIDGRLEVLDTSIDDDELAACVAALGNDATGINADLSLDLQGVRVRVNAFDHMTGHAVAARLVRANVPGLGDLGLPAELAAIVEHRDGLVLVCGPTGSGKSTTLASLIDLLDQRRAAHVVTLEDPIEYRFPARRCLIHQRELGTHISSFAAGLRAALREAPDVILLGELRDRETLAAALTAAETGHLVLATLHASSAAGAIDRVIDAFPESQQRQIRSQLAAALRTIVTQYLLPRRDGGRAVAVEYVPVTAAVANIIRKGDLHTLPTAIQSGRDAGMIPLERSLAKLLDTGAVAAPVVKRIAADHDLLAALAGKLR